MRAVLALVLAAFLLAVPVSGAAEASSSGSITYLGSSQFEVQYINLYWIPEVSVQCDSGYLNVQTEPESMYESMPWFPIFSDLIAGQSCTASFFYVTWKGCRDPKAGPFYCKEETGEFTLTTITFTS